VNCDALACGFDRFRRMKSIAWIAAAVLLPGCSRNTGPSYPSDWPALSSATASAGSASRCPDLTGSYLLPKNAAAPLRGARRKGEFEFVHYLLGVNSQHGKWLGMPAKLQLEGPGQKGLKVTFYRPDGEVTVEGWLHPGVDFTCSGKWIIEMQRNHSDDYITTSYARDVDGRLIGFKGNAAADAGVIRMFGFPVPLIGYSIDRVWWRIEPASDDSAGG
jgi:hypothetical protein